MIKVSHRHKEANKVNYKRHIYFVSANGIKGVRITPAIASDTKAIKLHRYFSYNYQTIDKIDITPLRINNNY